MKVLFVTRGWPTADNPMPGNYEAVQAKALAKKGVDVTVLNFRWRSVFGTWHSRKPYCFVEDGVRVCQLEGYMAILPHLWDSPRRKWWAKKLFVRWFCRKFVKEYGPFDIVHAHILYMADLAVAFKTRCRLPFVITEHWSKVNDEQVDIECMEMSKAYCDADAIITVSQALADSLKNKFGVKSHIIHNMVPDSFFSNLAISRVDGTIRFVSTGALREGKRFDILIQALAISKHRAECHLTIIGDGSEREYLQRCINEHGLQDQVTLAGRKTPEEVSQLLTDADCFALTSRRETFGIVYIEAMAKGLPVIATICGGPESFVNEQNGLLIPTDDVEATAHAIDYMVEHTDDYDHQAIQRFCYDHFSQDRIADQIIDVYHKVLTQNQ